MTAHCSKNENLNKLLESPPPPGRVGNFLAVLRSQSRVVSLAPAYMKKERKKPLRSDIYYFFLIDFNLVKASF